MTVAEIQKRLDDRFRLLRGSGRGGVERHQTLQATVQWSHDLLNETDQQNGLAHFLEHMSFNGSTHFAPGELIPYLNKMGMQFLKSTFTQQVCSINTLTKVQ